MNHRPGDSILEAARAALAQHALPTLVARRNERAAALHEKRQQYALASRQAGPLGRVLAKLSPRSALARLEAQHIELARELAADEHALETANTCAFSTVPPLGVTASAVAICDAARRYFRRGPGFELNCRTTEQRLTESLVSLARRVVDLWVPWFDPGRFVARCRAQATPRQGATDSAMPDPRLGWRPIDEDGLVDLAISWQTSADGHRLLALAERESPATQTDRVAKVSASELADRGLLAGVAAYPPMRVWLATQRIVWLLHGTEWPPAELVLCPDGKARWTNLLVPRAWLLVAVAQLESATHDAFPGLTALLGGKPNGGLADRQLDLERFVDRASLHASVLSGATIAGAQASARVGLLDRVAIGSESAAEERVRTASALAERHRHTILLIAAEQARLVRSTTMREQRFRVRNHLVAIALLLEKIRTVEKPQPVFARSAPVFGLERTLGAVQLLVHEITDWARRCGERDLLHRTLSTLVQAIGDIHAVCVGRSIGENPGSHWELAGVEAAESALASTGKAAFAAYGAMPSDGEILMGAVDCPPSRQPV